MVFNYSFTFIYFQVPRCHFLTKILTLSRTVGMTSLRFLLGFIERYIKVENGFIHMLVFTANI